MRFKMFAIAVSIFCLMAGMAVAADVTGTWIAEMAGGPGGGGQGMTITFNLKADGAALTGNVEAMGNANDIDEGKIEGDNISFSQTVDMQGSEMKVIFKGTVSGDEMKLTFTMGGGGGPGGGGAPPMEMVAKRQK